jgi:hypothetical protein
VSLTPVLDLNHTLADSLILQERSSATSRTRIRDQNLSHLSDSPFPSASHSGQYPHTLLPNHVLTLPLLHHRPSLGAYFASQPLPLSSRVASNTKWNVYAFPAAISVGLLVLETVYLAFKLPETKDYKKSRQVVEKDAGRREEAVKESFEVRRNRLRKLGRLHGFFLLFFSGVSRRKWCRTRLGLTTVITGRVHFDFSE